MSGCMNGKKMGECMCETDDSRSIENGDRASERNQGKHARKFYKQTTTILTCVLMIKRPCTSVCLCGQFRRLSRPRVRVDYLL